MGQIKNIKLHIVTDIKCKNTIRSELIPFPTSSSTSSTWFTAKCGSLTPEVTAKVHEDVESAPINTVSSESMDSVSVDNASKNTLKISASRNLNNKRNALLCKIKHLRF